LGLGIGDLIDFLGCLAEGFFGIGALAQDGEGDESGVFQEGGGGLLPEADDFEFVVGAF
jgi:hypothetical protein